MKIKKSNELSTFPSLLIILALVIFSGGSFLHYKRGYYYRDIPKAHAIGMDDAYITYRYGWNIAHFDKLSWNESGYRRTEGFTNPLWVYLSALISLTNDKDAVYPAVVLSSIVFSLFILFILFKSVFAKYSQQSAMTGLILLAASPIVWLHTASGLESSVFGFIIATIAYLSIFENKRFPLSIFILTIFACSIRSDGFIYVASILFSLVIARYKITSLKEIVLGLFLGSISLLVWRMMTFEKIFPNTAIAKLSHSLLERAHVGIMLYLFIIFSTGLAIFVIIGVWGSRKSGNTKYFCSSISVILLWTTYYIYMGGDLFLERHLLGTMIFSAAASAPFWINLNISNRTFVIVLALLALYTPFLMNDTRFSYEQPKTYDPWIELGKSLQYDRENYGVIVTFPAGKIPFFAGGDFIDSIGLNDEDLAKYKNDRFVPGHSTGRLDEAIKIAKEHPSGRYSLFTYLDASIISDPKMIKSWVNNNSPQLNETNYISYSEWNQILESGNYWDWSIIVTFSP